MADFGSSVTPHRFRGRVAIVTGASHDPSIGRSTAERLGREGASVVINVITSHVDAQIGDNAVTDAAGTTAVTAQSSLSPATGTLFFNPSSLAVAGGGSLGSSVAGSVVVDVINRDTQATIGDGAQVNQATPGTAACGAC